MLVCLLELGMTEQDVIELMRRNSLLVNARDKDIRPYIEFLRAIGCAREQIMTIVEMNPYLFDYDLKHLISVCNYLKETLLIEDLPKLVSRHTYLFNKHLKKLQAFTESRLEKGMSIEEIRDEVTNDPFSIEFIS